MSSNKQENKEKIIKKIVALMFSFLMTLCIATFLLLVGCKVGIFNQSIILNQLDKTDYYANVNQAIIENSAELLRPSGLPKEVLDEVITQAQVKKDARNMVINGLQGEGYIPDTTVFDEPFEANIQTYIETNGIETNENTEIGVDKVLEQIKSEYSRCIKFPFIKYYAKYQNLFNRMFYMVAMLFLGLAIIIGVVLVRMNKWPHQGMRYVCYATVAAGIVVIVPSVILMTTKIYTRLNIAPKYMYDLIVGVLNQDVIILFVVALLGFVAFGVELYVVSRMKYKATHHGIRRHRD